ncbi:DNA translocase FtsK 4TM domain-containing protein [Clostridia bacterium]|nr:DNA translocase FtsK 4TM domain-containing protein [Clostridia bacterium]
MILTKRKQETKKESNIKRRLVGISILAISSFLLVSFVLTQNGNGDPEQIGLAGGFFSRTLMGIFGKAGIVVPSVGLLLGLLFLIGYRENNLKTNLAGFFLLLLSVLGIFSVDAVMKMQFMESVRLGLQGEGGGVLGMGLSWVLYQVLGRLGSYIFLAATLVGGLLMLLEGFRGGMVSNAYHRFMEKRRISKELKKEEAKKNPKRVNAKPEKANKLPDPKGPVIKHSAEFDENSYESVKDILMDENIGKQHAKKDKIEQAKKKTEPKDIGDERLEEQMEISLKAEKNNVTNNKAWNYPSLELLRNVKDNNRAQSEKEVQDTANLLEQTLESFGVKLKIDQISIGPAITRYEAKLAPGIKVSKILRLADDIALSLAAPNIRIEAPIPGKAAIGIEVPNKTVREVTIREILGEHAFMNQKGNLTVALGKDIAGQTVYADLAKMPHLLIAGATGSGKSVCMNTLICSLLYKYRPDEMKFLMVDPKKVELTTYNEVPHLVAPVITEPKKAATALKWMTAEMENRYSLFAKEGVKDIYGYNKKMLEKQASGQPSEGKLPYIVILIDELADLMMVSPADVEDSICRLAQMARAAGMHLVIATQRPSVNVITGLIKANVPSRIAFAVSSQVDSRTILDGAGAEKLLGRGDMLFSPVGLNKPRRVQGANITETEVSKVVGFLKEQAKPEYLQGIEMLDQQESEPSDSDEEYDELLMDAGALVIESGQASISMLQRRLKIGYTRAARIIDQLEDKNIVGAYQGSKARQVLVGWDEFNRIFNQENEE